ncbi:MAG: PilZ domain-containing protein [Candidatus Auribacterota bacterium]|jgi:c-di-GMP-binding flagellar brake protein YcgR|nr:PilZ domain-containing protein [Candidatus Auribacterota bacterium]
MKDRRKYQRYQRQIPVRVKWEGKELEGVLMDLSMTGAGCFIDKRLPLYAEVEIQFLPEEPFAGQEEMFHCSGVVVRCCKVSNRKEYQLGIFFTRLSEEILANIMDLAYY